MRITIYEFALRAEIKTIPGHSCVGTGVIAVGLDAETAILNGLRHFKKGFNEVTKDDIQVERCLGIAAVVDASGDQANLLDDDAVEQLWAKDKNNSAFWDLLNAQVEEWLIEYVNRPGYMAITKGNYPALAKIWLEEFNRTDLTIEEVATALADVIDTFSDDHHYAE